MSNNKIEKLRSKLNEMIISENVDKKKLQKLSEQLDVAIVDSMKQKNNSNLNSNTIKEIESMLDNLNLYKKMYQWIRIVDPVEKKIYNLNKSDIIDINEKCHKFWKENKVCSNCIALKAFKGDDTIFKLNIMKNKIYMIIAVPVQIQEKKFVLEMIKNTTDNLIIEAESNNEIKKLIEKIDIINK